MVRFVKAHACGNDFLIVDEAEVGKRHADLARRLCSRNTGVGADGIEFLDRTSGYRLRLFNSDGTEAELSGNGTRCVAAWLAKSEGLEDVTFETHGGPRRCRAIETDGARFVMETSMGVPRVMPQTIVLPEVGEVAGVAVNVGNPHFVIFVDHEDFQAHGLAWQELGAKISGSPIFRHGTNVDFVRVTSATEIEFRIYERGCGPTRSSGTGTCASAAAAMEMRGASRELGAIAEGGAQRVVWASRLAEMLLTGPAEIVCTGEAIAF